MKVVVWWCKIEQHGVLSLIVLENKWYIYHGTGWHADLGILWWPFGFMLDFRQRI